MSLFSFSLVSFLFIGSLVLTAAAALTLVVLLLLDTKNKSIW
ncbi:MAG: hypothetical protein AAGK14_08060 [Verrucomicrobiota bacterium]